MNDDDPLNLDSIFNDEEFEFSPITKSYVDTNTVTNWYQPAAPVKLDENGITLEDAADITIQGRSLSKSLQSIEDRLKILVPNFEKHEKYPALKDAYEHYKLIERLLDEGSEDNSSSND